MPSIVPPRTDTQDQNTVLESLAPPCEYTAHDRYGTGPAAWIVWYRPRPCGCTHTPYVLFCDGCWEGRGSRTGEVMCLSCKARFSRYESILRVERI